MEVKMKDLAEGLEEYNKLKAIAQELKRIMTDLETKVEAPKFDGHILAGTITCVGYNAGEEKTKDIYVSSSISELIHDDFYNLIANKYNEIVSKMAKMIV